MTAPIAGRPSRPAPGFREFVAIIAFTMSLGALSMDSMLPAFGEMRAAFHLADPNEMQLTVVVFMAGFGSAQLFYGPLSDNWGRRRALMLGLAIFILGSLAAIAAPSFEVLILARLVQGIGAAATRIITTAVTRDRFEGAEMARVMALIMMVFIIVPVFAPSIGSLILVFGGWRLVFAFMLVMGLGVALWFHLRMPETLHPDYRMPLSARRIGAAALRCIRTKQSLAAATSTGLLYGCLMAYIATAEQIFAEGVYGLGSGFPLVFGLIAALMGGASFANSRLVRRLGIRRLLHTGQCGFVVAALVMVLLGLVFDGKPPLVAFCLNLTACLFLFSLTMPNFNALAMSPLGDVAGTASSLIGFYTTVSGAALGGVVARFFDGTVMPLSIGFLLLGTASLLVTLWAEGGRLFGDAPAAR